MLLNMQRKIVKKYKKGIFISFILDRKQVTVAHKAGVMKLADGLFLDSALTISKEYPEIECRVRNIETICLHLSSKPNILDVMVISFLSYVCYLFFFI